LIGCATGPDDSNPPDPSGGFCFWPLPAFRDTLRFTFEICEFFCYCVILFWDRSLEVSSGFTPRTTPARAFDALCA
jgi:hypothetical protein